MNKAQLLMALLSGEENPEDKLDKDEIVKAVITDEVKQKLHEIIECYPFECQKMQDHLSILFNAIAKALHKALPAIFMTSETMQEFALTSITTYLKSIPISIEQGFRDNKKLREKLTKLATEARGEQQ